MNRSERLFLALMFHKTSNPAWRMRTSMQIPFEIERGQIAILFKII